MASESVLVPVEASERLCGLLTGYGEDLGYMSDRDRAVVVERGRVRWAQILEWASAGVPPSDGGQQG